MIKKNYNNFMYVLINSKLSLSCKFYLKNICKPRDTKFP